MSTGPRGARVPKPVEQGILQKTVRAARLAVLGVAIVSFFVNVLMLTVPLYMLQIFDRVLASRSEDTLIYLTIAAIGALAVLGGLDMLRGRVLARVSTWMEQQLSSDALSRAVGAMLDFRGFGSQPLRDITVVRQFIGSPGLLTLFDAPWVPIYILVIYLLHPILGLVALGGAVSLFALALVTELATRKPLSDANDQWARAMRKTDAAIRNAEVIEAMGLMPGIVRRWLDDNRDALRLQERASDRAGILVAFSKFLRLTLQVAMLGIGAYLVVHEQITAGVMIAGSIILSRALQPVEQAIGTWKYLIAARAAYHRLQDFFLSAPVRETDIGLPPPHGHLLVERVVFMPRGSSKPTLKGVSLSVDPGEILAIVGPSGAGKSTLARLLVGAWRPHAGAVRLDGADVYAWERVDFGRHVGYLPQDVELFEGTIAENIARLREAEPESVVEAAQHADIHELILALPGGYSTMLGEGGLTLSGGQRQRIGLARALFGQPRLLVLDEPNANLDADGEAALLGAMTAARERGAVVVFISHRPNLVACADKVLFLREGVAELFGPREQVLPKLTRPSVVNAPTQVHGTEIARRGTQ
jgi:PrtD family type I secretion system ABC transporter